MTFTSVEVTTDEGFTLRGHSSGDGPRLLLALHGGPGGSGGDYLHLLHRLAGPSRRVVTFDQLGTGRSDVPPEPYAWSMTQAALDVDAVRRSLGAEVVDVLGHSYGGMLALQYALDHPHHLGRLVLSSTCAGTAHLEEVFVGQVHEVASAEDAEYALAADAERRHDDPVFLSVLRAWLSGFFTNGDESITDELLAESLASGPAGRGLWGGSLWTSDGALRTWGVEDRLSAVSAPTLAIHGGHDTSTRAINSVFAERIPDCEWLTMNRNGHDMLEEPNHPTYLSILRAFLDSWPVEGEQADAV